MLKRRAQESRRMREPYEWRAGVHADSQARHQVRLARPWPRVVPGSRRRRPGCGTPAAAARLPGCCRPSGPNADGTPPTAITQVCSAQTARRLCRHCSGQPHFAREMLGSVFHQFPAAWPRQLPCHEQRHDAHLFEVAAALEIPSVRAGRAGGGALVLVVRWKDAPPDRLAAP